LKTKIKNLIISGSITAVIGYFLIPLFITVRYSHRTEWDNFDKLWLFQDSVKPYVDTLVALAQIRKSDAEYWYHLYQTPQKGLPLGKSRYHVLIWEFNDLESFDIKNSQFNTNVDLDIDDYSGGVIENPGGEPSLFVKSKMPFNNFININLNRSSTIIKYIDSTNYKGFYGKINKLSLNNEKNKLLALFDNQAACVNTLFLLYKKQTKLYIIYLFSDYEVDENALRIFNLN